MKYRLHLLSKAGRIKGIPILSVCVTTVAAIKPTFHGEAIRSHTKESQTRTDCLCFLGGKRVSLRLPLRCEMTTQKKRKKLQRGAFLRLLRAHFTPLGAPRISTRQSRSFEFLSPATVLLRLSISRLINSTRDKKKKKSREKCVSGLKRRARPP